MGLSTRQQDILALITDGPITVYALADRIFAPEASVRRDVQALRRAGYNINDARDNNGLYRLA